jgi:hypothetical protein
MGKLVNDFLEIGSFGILDDPLGIDQATRSGQQAAQVQADVAREGIAAAKEQQLFERQNTKLDRQQSTARYREQFDLNQDRFDLNRADNAPRIEAGNQAIAQQQALLGLSGQDAQQAAYGGIQESAGQRFLRERQQRALVRNSSAIGGLGGGNVRTALQEQAAGFAMQDVNNQFGRLGQLAGQGQNASNSSAQAGGMTSPSGTNVNTNTASNSAGNIINAQSNLGAAQATGILAPSQANTAVSNQLLQLGGIGLANSDKIANLFS